jgi:hypothetical protein
MNYKAEDASIKLIKLLVKFRLSIVVVSFAEYSQGIVFHKRLAGRLRMNGLVVWILFFSLTQNIFKLLNSAKKASQMDSSVFYQFKQVH